MGAAQQRQGRGCTWDPAECSRGLRGEGQAPCRRLAAGWSSPPAAGEACAIAATATQPHLA